MKFNKYDNHYSEKLSLGILFIIGRYSHNGTYLIKSLFCLNFFSKVAVVKNKINHFSLFNTP